MLSCLLLIRVNLLGTPDTNLRGLRTLIARKVLRSTPCAPSPFSGVTKVINLKQFPHLYADINYCVLTR